MAERAANGAPPPLLFVFLDGVGLGDDDPAVNPFVAASTPFLEGVLGGRLSASLAPKSETHLLFKSLDATLGHGGLPQSATGQTALLTGHNGADVMGGHYGPWPGPTLKAVLDRGTLFSHTTSVHVGGAQLANAYPPGYFQALERGRLKVNVPVYAVRAAGLALNTLSAYARGEALSVDLTGAQLQRFDPALPVLTPFEMGRRAAALARRAAFTFFDYWPSDQVGHRGSFAEATHLVEALDAFLRGVVAGLDEVTLLVTSDHGNLEDKRTKTHTRAPVPMIAYGPAASAFAGASSLLDVAPIVKGLLTPATVPRS